MNDLFHIENILKILRRGKFDLGGEEILAFYKSFEYLINKRTQLLKEKEQPTITSVTQDPIKTIENKPSKKSKKVGS